MKVTEEMITKQKTIVEKMYNELQQLNAKYHKENSTLILLNETYLNQQRVAEIFSNEEQTE